MEQGWSPKDHPEGLMLESTGWGRVCERGLPAMGAGVLVSTIQGTPGSECILSRNQPRGGLVLTPLPSNASALDPISAGMKWQQQELIGSCRRLLAKEHRPACAGKDGTS